MGVPGVVLTIYVNCTQQGEGRTGVAAIAAIYGQAENCRLLGSCHVASNEFTLRSMVCGGNVAPECGRTLFRDFDNYWSAELAATESEMTYLTNDTTHYRIEFEQEEDGRWIADMPELPGVMAYGSSKREAESKVQVIALQVQGLPFVQ